MIYKELIKRLREKAGAFDYDGRPDIACDYEQVADAIEKLIKVASAMHTWIFLHTGDEQTAYDECGLTDEMNAELGYGGQFVIEPPKELV